MTRKQKVHLDATQAGNVARAALCGWLDVSTTSDPTAVSCEACKRAMRRAGSAQRTRSKRGGLVPESELKQVIAEAFRSAPLAPKAGPPPRLTAPLWEASCRGAEHRRCGACVICVWERECERYAFSSPWNRTHSLRRQPGAPVWPSLTAALSALVDWERRDRQAPSALGPVLDRLRAGMHSDGGANRPEDPMLRRAAELVPVRQALELAYPAAGIPVHNAEGAVTLLPRGRCIDVLLDRTEGVRPTVPTYEEISADFGLIGFAITIGDLKAVVRTGRRRVTIELAARGLIPMPKSSVGLAEDIEAARGRYGRAS